MDIYVIAIVISVLLSGLTSYLVIREKGKNKEIILDSLREQVLSLFLYAEKQGWTGPEKMQWCVDKVYGAVQSTLPIKKDDLAVWMQKLYDAVKELLQKEIKVSE